ncbi:MAG TPA: copper resistance system multicopper oxidase [Micropepsaceae bacterium]|nr:copper resistance system multicopper oxidase [Micropepsaceae bacterium]
MSVNHGGHLLNRRRFVHGMAAFGATSALWRGPAWGQTSTGTGPAILTGDRFDLTIGSIPVNITGRPRKATVINGTMPGPTLRMREGDTVTINVHNQLDEPTSLHWHGILLPNTMDGVPGLTFRGIMPGETFTYRFPVRQSGTYWYHSHSGDQEQTGTFGALMLTPQQNEPFSYDREYVVTLSDWTDEDPMSILSNLKQQPDYYDFQQRTLGNFIQDAKSQGLGAALQDRLMWGQMRMSPTDIVDVTGAAYTFLINGHSPAANWTALFNAGERIRLRFINSAAMTTFDVRIPGLPLTVVAADGSDIEPVVVGEFRIGVAETYDIIVTPRDAAFTIFAQAEDRSGYARATLAPRPGMVAAIPPMDPRPLRTMQDMGMGAEHMHGAAAPVPPKMAMAMAAAMMGSAANNADHIDPMSLAGKTGVDNVAMMPTSRLSEPGSGLEDNGRRVLVYSDLKSLKARRVGALNDYRDIVFHLTGNMQRFVWGFDGKKFSEAGPVQIKLGERIRFVLINDTMMEHPIHLHGFIFALENGQGDQLPLKHTVNVKPGERLSFVFDADTPGHWAFHCHLLYHMDAGMFRTVIVA